ncbi:hypothetical protein HNP00_004672 [Arthrobacter sp. AZCC_0090]|nr:hypothetical protein [Arthrobacter sp. AZCC_0090]
MLPSRLSLERNPRGSPPELLLARNEPRSPRPPPKLPRLPPLCSAMMDSSCCELTTGACAAALILILFSRRRDPARISYVILGDQPSTNAFEDRLFSSPWEASQLPARPAVSRPALKARFKVKFLTLPAVPGAFRRDAPSRMGPSGGRGSLTSGAFRRDAGSLIAGRGGTVLQFRGAGGWCIGERGSGHNGLFVMEGLTEVAYR